MTVSKSIRCSHDRLNRLRTWGPRVVDGCCHDRLNGLRTSGLRVMTVSKSIGRSQDGLSWLRTSGPGDRDAGAAIERALSARRGAQERRH